MSANKFFFLAIRLLVETEIDTVNDTSIHMCAKFNLVEKHRILLTFSFSFPFLSSCSAPWLKAKIGWCVAFSRRRELPRGKKLSRDIITSYKLEIIMSDSLI